jgi:hypothetical protein
MNENQYEKIRVLFLKLIEETKELSKDEFEVIVQQVIDQNEQFTPQMKERLTIDITNMRNKLINMKN